MDLSSIKPATITIDIKHPGTGRPTGLLIECTSLEAEAVKRVQREHANKILRSRNRKLTAEQIEEQTIDQITAAVVGWTWGGEAAWTGGKKPDFKADAVREVVSAGWVKSQIQEALEDDAAFFTN